MKMVLYHGSDRIVQKPLFGFGKEDNDYGSGFYTTEDIEKARAWAVVNGANSAVCNKYSIDLSQLNILRLDDYGPLAWIAEIIEHRGTRTEEAKIIGEKFVEKYKINTDTADIIIGYRADDSYIDIVDAFLKNQLSIEEVDRLFHKGNLGQQVFIKSQKAFDNLSFEGYEYVDDKGYSEEEAKARIEATRFLYNRFNAIQLNGFQPTGIIARDAIKTKYVYDKNYAYCYPIIDKENEENEYDDK